MAIAKYKNFEERFTGEELKIRSSFNKNILLTEKELKDYAMKSVLACSALNRPSMCRLDTNMCCFNCPKWQKCTEAILTHNAKISNKKNRDPLPCSPNDFDEHEICEFSI